MKKKYLFLALLFLLIVLLNPTSVEASTIQAEDQQEESENSPTDEPKPTATPKPSDLYSFLDEGDLVISIKDPNILIIRNITTETYFIGIELLDFNFLSVDDDPKDIDSNKVFNIRLDNNEEETDTSKIKITSLELKSFIIEVNKDELEKIKPGTYTGYIKIIYDATDDFLLKKVSIEVPDGRITPLEMPQTEWSTMATCYYPPFADYIQCVIKEPYFFITGNDADEYSWMEGETIGYLEDKRSNVVEVKVKSIKLWDPSVEKKFKPISEEGQPTVTVTSTKDESEQAKSDQRLLKVNLSIGDIITWGTYTGSLNVYSKFNLPKEESKSLTYTVTSQHHVQYPFILFTVSILAAIIVENWTGKSRKIQLLKYKIRRLKKKLPDRLVECVESKEGDSSINPKPEVIREATGYYKNIEAMNDVDGIIFNNAEEKAIDCNKILALIKMYSIDKDFSSNCDILLRDINSLRLLPLGKMNVDDEQFSKIVNAVNALEKSLDYWNDLGNKYVNLFSALVKFFLAIEDKEGPIWPCEAQKIQLKYPKFYDNATKLLLKEPEKNGNKETDDSQVHFKISDLGKLINDIDEIIVLLKNWHLMEEEIQFFRKYIKKLNETEPIDFIVDQTEHIGEALYSANKIIHQAWGELWVCDDPTELKDRLTESDIAKAEEKLFELYGFYHEKVGAWETKPLVKPRSISKFIEVTLDKVEEFIIEDVIPALYGVGIKSGDLISLAITLTIGAITAYGTLYYQKPFGAANDYILVVTTAFAAKVLISFLGDGIRKMRFLTME